MWKTKKFWLVLLASYIAIKAIGDFLAWHFLQVTHIWIEQLLLGTLIATLVINYLSARKAAKPHSQFLKNIPKFGLVLIIGLALIIGSPLFGLVGLLLYLTLGLLVNSPVFYLALIIALIEILLIKKFARPENRKIYLLFCIASCLLSVLSEINIIFDYLSSYISTAWIGLAVINQFWKPKPLTVNQVQDKVRNLDRDLKVLKGYGERQELTNYQMLAPKILDQLTQLRTELTQIKKQVKPQTYNRLLDRIASEEGNIKAELNLIQNNSEELKHRQAQSRLEKLAPELLQTVASIERDSQTITQKIQEASSGNRAELLQLHQTQMTRYQAVLEGYLKIKESPKDYYDADQRLQAAKETIEQFDLELDEQLRQLNEDAMHDFEVNLRLMTEHKNN